MLPLVLLKTSHGHPVVSLMAWLLASLPASHFWRMLLSQKVAPQIVPGAAALPGGESIALPASVAYPPVLEASLCAFAFVTAPCSWWN